MANAEIFDFLLRRRSAGILTEPRPTAQDLHKILSIAATAPDHGALRPYRFVVVEGDAQARFGDALVNAADENRPEKLEDKVKPKIKAKAFAAPLQVLIIFSPVPSDKIHDWEQMAAASCTGFGLVLGANALGFGAVWKSFAYDPGSALRDLCQLKEKERLLGWVNIGTEKDRDRSERDPLNLNQHALFLK